MDLDEALALEYCINSARQEIECVLHLIDDVNHPLDDSIQTSLLSSMGYLQTAANKVYQDMKAMRHG